MLHSFEGFHFSRLLLSRSAIAGIAALAATLASAQTCPFDDGNSSLAVEGLVLTRHALGINGPAMLANTGIDVAQASNVAAIIDCPNCGLNITGNATMTVTDATIISRRLAGLSGSALTNGLNLGSGIRNTPAAVQSFLLAGCGVASNGFVQGGNAFGATGVLGTTDARNLRVVTGGSALSLELPGGNGLRVLATTGSFADAPNMVAGSSVNQVGNQAATVAGGGFNANSCAYGGLFPRSCANVAAALGSTVSGGVSNVANAVFSTVGGGTGNTVADPYSVVSGGTYNAASGAASVISGGTSNVTNYSGSVVAGGSNNSAGACCQPSNGFATVGGGDHNVASGTNSTIPGGSNNLAQGYAGFAAGQYAQSKFDGSFVWGDASTITPIADTGTNQFVVRAAGGVRLDDVATNLFFGTTGRQMINLYDTSFGIGVQTGTTYFRTNTDFCWFKGGLHTGSGCTSGGSGTTQMALRSTQTFTTAVGHLYAATFNAGSDRALKDAIRTINPRQVLAKVLSLPITSWAYKSDAQSRHIGPMAQDFYNAFGLGGSDKSIATVDADGVALAAIQGLHQLVKAKDAKIDALEKANVQLQRDMAAIKQRLGM